CACVDALGDPNGVVGAVHEPPVQETGSRVGGCEGWSETGEGDLPVARTSASSGVVARARWFVRARGSPKNYQSFIRDINNLLTPNCSNGIIDTYLALAIGEC
ncbi:MAG: hypothetical protein ACYDH2_10230, partial [Anaerolineaceae bacterium]